MSERERVSLDDLGAAVEWLEAYEGEDETLPSLLRVAAMLRQEIEDREIRRIMREAGVSRSAARLALRRVRAGKTP